MRISIISFVYTKAEVRAKETTKNINQKLTENRKKQEAEVMKDRMTEGFFAPMINRIPRKKMTTIKDKRPYFFVSDEQIKRCIEGNASQRIKPQLLRSKTTAKFAKIVHNINVEIPKGINLDFPEKSIVCNSTRKRGDFYLPDSAFRLSSRRKMDKFGISNLTMVAHSKPSSNKIKASSSMYKTHF